MELLQGTTAGLLECDVLGIDYVAVVSIELGHIHGTGMQSLALVVSSRARALMNARARLDCLLPLSELRHPTASDSCQRPS